jgi:hypothetical protein
MRKNNRASERNGRLRAPTPVQELWRRPPSCPWAATGELTQIRATASTSRSRGRRRPFVAPGLRRLTATPRFSLVTRLGREEERRSFGKKGEER